MVNNRLKIMRKSTKYTQIKLAQLVNVAQSTYSDWETGRKNIHAENIKKLAELYNVSTDFLLGRDFKITRPIECWSQAEQKEYYTANEYKKVYLEYFTGFIVTVLRPFCSMLKKAFGTLIYKNMEQHSQRLY